MYGTNGASKNHVWTDSLTLPLLSPCGLKWDLCKSNIMTIILTSLSSLKVFSGKNGSGKAVNNPYTKIREFLVRFWNNKYL